MTFSTLTTALLIVSIVTNITVEGIKKLLNETSKKYSANLLAAIVSIVVSIVASAIYLVMNDIAITIKIGVQVIILMYFAFLSSTLGYDKIIQMLNQIHVTKTDIEKKG